MSFITRLLLASLATLAVTNAQSQSTDSPQLSPNMPLAEDHTSLWWRDGFPGTVKGADWRRCIRTGHYWFMLDTDGMKVPRIGTVNVPVSELSGAELQLAITANGKSYQCTQGGPWTRFTGPRLIESGRFLQRADVTDLEFTDTNGDKLNVEARFETVAWPDRLGLILAARPGLLPIASNETAFGRIGGGYGLDGENLLEFDAEESDTPEIFTIEFWAFIPSDYRASKHAPWLMCKNGNELVDGNYGIMLHRNQIPEVRINLGGGRDNSFTLRGSPQHTLQLEQWNHVAFSYDSRALKLYIHGKLAAEKLINRKRSPNPGILAFGGRQDRSGDGYRFRGAVDEIKIYDRPLTASEIAQRYRRPEQSDTTTQPKKSWSFQNNRKSGQSRIRERWENASINIRLKSSTKVLESQWDSPNDDDRDTETWKQAALNLDPVAFHSLSNASRLRISAAEVKTGIPRPVSFDSTMCWHRINLDGIAPTNPEGVTGPSNDAIERVRFTLANPTAEQQTARLMFEKTAAGIKHRIGTPITGISAVIRDLQGNPTGIPVQLSKNWHRHTQGGVYSGQWFHAISQVHLQPGESLTLELCLAYGHWGGIPAVSHSQLSLIGWGGNQRWDQTAIGSWGESLCFEPEQVQAACSITDVRPLMVRSMKGSNDWGWTENVGGADYLRLFQPDGQRVSHVGMQADYQRQGPCLTETTYSGSIGKTGIHQKVSVSIARSDDILVGTYRILMRVTKPVDYSRFVIFQTAADSYATTRDYKLAVGNLSGLIREWPSHNNTASSHKESLPNFKAIQLAQPATWASLHGTRPASDAKGAVASRGFVIRDWKAKLGGRSVTPWITEHFLPSKACSTMDLVPPPNLTRLLPGDFIEATIEHIVIPIHANDYYGPDKHLREALNQSANSWQMIHRQAKGNKRDVKVISGKLIGLYPSIQIIAENDVANLTLSGGLNYVPITIQNLTSHSGYDLTINGKRLDQSVHGKDYWQTDFDPKSRRWSQTYNIPAPNTDSSVEVKLAPRQ